MAGLETLPDATRVARLVRSVAGAEPRGVRPLGAGVTTLAWEVEAEPRSFVVLLARPGAEDPRFGGQLAIFDRWHAADDRAPAAVAWCGDPEHDDLTLGHPPLSWAVVSRAGGAAVGDRVLSEEAARDLGHLLAGLHGLPATGFGRIEDRRDAIVGRGADMASGFLQRWPRLWPFDGSALIARPFARIAPRLVAALAPLEPTLRRFGSLPRGVPLHGDLNPAHVFVDDAGRLTGVIDLSDAFIGPPAVDLTSFAFHFGWNRTAALLAGYTGEPALREVRLLEARLFAATYAVHRSNKGVERGDDDQVRRAVAFLEETLPLVAHATREV